MSKGKLKEEIMHLDIDEMQDVLEDIVELKKMGEHINVLFWGSPGIGKTQSVKTCLDNMGYECRLLGVPTMDPTDIGGYPKVDGEYTINTVPRTLIPTKNGKKLAIFADELNRASNMVQNSLLSLFQERQVKEFKLDPETILIAAANHEGDDIGIQAASRALSNRFIQIYLKTNINAFMAHAIPNDFHPAVIATLKFRPNLLNPAYDDSDPVEMQKWKDKKAFPTPRSWETASKLIKVAETREVGIQKMRNHILQAELAGAVGMGPAIELMAVYKTLTQLPSIDNIFMNPTSAMLPEEPSACFAVSIAVSRRITEDNIEAGLCYLNRLPLEYNVLAVKHILSRDQSLTATKAYSQWALANEGKF